MSNLRYVLRRLLLLVGLAFVLLTAVIAAVLNDTTGAQSVNDWIEAHPTTTAAPLCLDLNTATVEELLQLPGMTKRIAEGIVRYREELVRFRSVDELRTLSDITEDQFRAWRPYLTV